MKSLQIAATGMAAQQLRVDVISNNIANMSTAAYRPRTAEFSDLMYQQYLTPGTITLDVRNNEMLVHALTKETAEGLMTGDMDRRVTRLEGGT